MYIYMGASILYPSRQNSSDCSPNKIRQGFFILPTGLRTILCGRAHHITEPKGVGLGPIEPKILMLARNQVPGLGPTGDSWLRWARP